MNTFPKDGFFSKRGYIIKVARNFLEPDNVWYERGWFIVSQLHCQNHADIDTLTKYSNIYSNVKFLKVNYSPEVIKELDIMIKNMN